MNERVIQDLAQAIGLFASGDSNAGYELLRRIAAGAPGQATLPGMPAAPEPGQSTQDAAKRLFVYWQQRCDHKTAKLTPERARAVIGRLRQGYTEAEIRKAIDGAAEAAYQNDDSGKKYDDLELICRNGTKLESFIERGVAKTGAIDVDDTAASKGGVEEQITTLRRKMAELRRDGRSTEYEIAQVELAKLMEKRR